MYDDLICEMALPDGFTHTSNFQTKSLDNALERYIITAEGELWCEPYTWVEAESNDREPERIPYHGWISFYTGFFAPYDREKPKARLRVWLEYDAKFTDGKCVEIQVNPHSDTVKEPIADVVGRITEIDRLCAKAQFC